MLSWARQVNVIWLSAIVVDELCFGLSWRPNERVQAWLDAFFEQHCQILPVTEAITRRSGELRGRLQASGITRTRTRTQADMMLASTAIEHNLTLVTRNTRDFEGCGVALLDPFV